MKTRKISTEQRRKDKEQQLRWLEECANVGSYRERFLEMAKVSYMPKYVAIFSSLEQICMLDNCVPNYMYDAYQDHGSMFAWALKDKFKFTNKQMQRLAWGLPQNKDWPRLTGTNEQRSDG